MCFGFLLLCWSCIVSLSFICMILWVLHSYRHFLQVLYFFRFFFFWGLPCVKTKRNRVFVDFLEHFWPSSVVQYWISWNLQNIWIIRWVFRSVFGLNEKLNEFEKLDEWQVYRLFEVFVASTAIKKHSLSFSLSTKT